MIISPEPWNHIFVSKHHYAVQLGTRGNTVYFLGPPGKNYDLSGTQYKNVFELKYKGFIRGLRYFPTCIIKIEILSVFKKLQTLCGVSFDIIWSFDNSVFFDFSALPKSVIKISHIVDLNQNFQTKKAAETALVCLGTTDLIVGRLKSFNPKSFKIKHGYNLTQDNKGDLKLPGESNTKAVYAGNLNMEYLDWQVLFYTIEQNEKVDFVFVGPGNDDFDLYGNITHKYKKLCLEKLNVFCVGKVGPEVLSAYYNKSDMLLICYQEAFHSHQANPHKMMEYLGSGKVVVATKTIEYISLKEKGLIAMSEMNSEFPQLFKQTVNQLEKYNGYLKQEERKEYALENTYEKQIERIETVISDNE